MGKKTQKEIVIDSWIDKLEKDLGVKIDDDVRKITQHHIENYFKSNQFIKYIESKG